MIRVKICGLTNVKDALVAVEAGADLLGFIFYPPSPRSTTPEQAQKIITEVQSASPDVHAVGVFVDETPEAVVEIASRCGLDAVQLHGDEPPEMVAALMAEGLDVFKAFRVRDEAFLAQMERCRPTAYLLDAYAAGKHGGTGQTFDWELAARAKTHGPILLAGGLTPANVARAVRAVHPWGVDTASGVEAAPGRKDEDVVRAFVAAAKSAAPDNTQYAIRNTQYDLKGFNE